MTAFVFRTQVRVEWGHCDPSGIILRRRIFEYFDANTWMLIESGLGVKRAKLAESFGVIGFAAVEAEVDLLELVKFGDLLDITSHIVKFGRSSFNVDHRIEMDGKLVATGREVRVWVAPSGNDYPNNMSAADIPEIVRVKLG